MKTLTVKFNSPQAGHRFNDAKQVVGEYVRNVGDVVDVEIEEANRLINAGIASEVKPSSK